MSNLKIEIEITEEEIKSALERKVRTAIAGITESYRGEEAIKNEVKKAWDAALTKIVLDVMKDETAIRQRVVEALEAKIKGQLQRVMSKKA